MEITVQISNIYRIYSFLLLIFFGYSARRKPHVQPPSCVPLHWLQVFGQHFLLCSHIRINRTKPFTGSTCHGVLCLSFSVGMSTHVTLKEVTDINIFQISCSLMPVDVETFSDPHLRSVEQSPSSHGQPPLQPLGKQHRSWIFKLTSQNQQLVVSSQLPQLPQLPQLWFEHRI